MFDLQDAIAGENPVYSSSEEVWEGLKIKEKEVG